MKAVVLIALAGLTICLSSCSTASRSMGTVNRTAVNAAQIYNNRKEIAAVAGVRSLGTAQRTTAVAERSYSTAQRSYRNAGATASRTGGTMGRLYDSITRSFR